MQEGILDGQEPPRLHLVQEVVVVLHDVGVRQLLQHRHIGKSDLSSWQKNKSHEIYNIFNIITI